MTAVYGDSTPFPHGADFIETIRHAVEQGVNLLAAQEAMTRAPKRTEMDGRQRQETRIHVAALGDALASTLSAFNAPTVIPITAQAGP